MSYEPQLSLSPRLLALVEEISSLRERILVAPVRFQAVSSGKLMLTPKQEHLLGLLREQGSLAPSEIWPLLKVSKQGATKLMKPLLEARRIEKRGTAKSGPYFLS